MVYKNLRISEWNITLMHEVIRELNLSGSDRMTGSQRAPQDFAGNHSPITTTKKKSSFISPPSPEATLAYELSRLKKADRACARQ